MRKKFFFMLVVVLVFPNLMHCAADKTHNLDSLQKKLQVTQSDSEKLRIMSDIVEATKYSQPSIAYSSAREILEITLKGKDRKKIANAYNLLGIISEDIGDYEKAIANEYKSLEAYEELKDSTGIAGCYLNLANAFKSKGEYKRALSFLSQAQTYFTKLKNKKGIAFTYNNMATIYEESEKPEDALPYLKKALAMKIELGDKRSIAGAYMNLGLVQNDLEQYDESLNNLSQALSLYRELKSRGGLSDVYINLGQLYTHKKNYVKSKEMLDSAYVLAKDHGSIQDLMGVNKAFYVLYRASGNGEKAIYFFDKYRQYKDSVLNESSAKQIAEMGVRYESDKKDKAIELLKKNAEIGEAGIRQNKVLIIGLASGIFGILLLALLLFNRFRFRQKINARLSIVNTQINEQKKEITDSIQYALRIQESVLQTPDKIQELLPESFLFYRPKEIVSGDFYWVNRYEGEITVVVVDNILQGVPGAFISLVGINLLNRAMAEEQITGLQELVEYVREGIQSHLSQMNKGGTPSRAMNFSVCRIRKNREVECFSTQNSIFLINSAGFQELESSANGVCKIHRLKMSEGEFVYLSTDGYADQPGGPNGSKLMDEQVKHLITEVSVLPPKDQGRKLGKAFQDWSINNEQVDDVLVLGFKLPF
jgi:tetratricopeptide (TPR) repeat protein